MREHNKQEWSDIEQMVKDNPSVLVKDFWREWNNVRTQCPTITPEMALEQGLVSDTRLLSSYIRFHRAESLSNKHRLNVKSRRSK